MAIRDLTLILGERGIRGAIWHWLYLPRSSDIQGYSALTDLGASTLSVTFLGLRKSQRSPL